VVEGYLYPSTTKQPLGLGCCRWAHQTVWCATYVTQPLRFGRSRPLELCLLVALDRHCSLSGAPLATALSSACTVPHCSRSQRLLQSTVARRSRCSTGAPDSPVNYSGARPEKPEGGEFGVVQSWCTGQSGAPDQGTLCSFATLILNPNFVLLLVCVEPSGAPDQGTLCSFATLILNPNFVLLLVCVEPSCTCRIYNL
jgi:hypothetical protein